MPSLKMCDPKADLTNQVAALHFISISPASYYMCAEIKALATRDHRVLQYAFAIFLRRRMETCIDDSMAMKGVVTCIQRV